MFDSSLKKALVPSLLSTGAVFAALASPIFMFGNETLKIEQGQQSRWKGTVRDAAVPYLTLAGVASLGLGVSSVAITGWRKASQQVERIDDALRAQTEAIQQRELHVQAALTSPQYLAQTGLDFFLDDEPVDEVAPVAFEPEKLNYVKPAKTTVAVNPPNSTGQPISASNTAVNRAQTPLASKLTADRQRQHAAAFEQALAEFHRATSETESVESITQTPIPLKQERRLSDRRTSSSHQTPDHSVPVIQSQPIAPLQPVVITPISAVPSVQSTIMPLTAAQGFLGFNRVTGQAPAPENWNASSSAQDHVTIEKIQSLQSQLQQIVSQIEALQVNLAAHQTMPPQATPEAESSAWVVDRAAS